MFKMWVLGAEGFLGMILIGLSVSDCREKMIRPVFLAAPCLTGALLSICVRGDLIWTILGSAAVASLFFAGTKASRGGIGEGDGLSAGTVCMTAGVIRTVEILFWAFLLAAVAAGVLLVLKKAGRKSTLPFLPFLTAAYLGVTIWNHIA